MSSNPLEKKSNVIAWYRPIPWLHLQNEGAYQYPGTNQSTLLTKQGIREAENQQPRKCQGFIIQFLLIRIN